MARNRRTLVVLALTIAIVSVSCTGVPPAEQTARWDTARWGQASWGP